MIISCSQKECAAAIRVSFGLSLIACDKRKLKAETRFALYYSSVSKGTLAKVSPVRVAWHLKSYVRSNREFLRGPITKSFDYCQFSNGKLQAHRPRSSKPSSSSLTRRVHLRRQSPSQTPPPPPYIPRPHIPRCPRQTTHPASSEEGEIAETPEGKASIRKRKARFRHLRDSGHGEEVRDICAAASDVGGIYVGDIGFEDG